MLEREDLKAYHGWLKYLTFRAEQARASSEPTAQLAAWATRILENPRLLSELRGVQEWAYESRADGSGQPFRINIPAKYDATRPLPLSLYLHGTGGNHLEHPQVPQQLTGWSADSDFIEVAVLGRGRGVGYVGLAEADVLDVLGYVSQHFRVDAERVHLVGPSMGGTGVMLLAARHPDRFASAWSVCGSALDIPVSNLSSLPVYATHGDEDWVQPGLMVRGAVERLLQLGGTAVWDEAKGHGHMVWKYHAGNERSRTWTFGRVRPRSKEVSHIDFTALDGDSSRAFWLAVAEWGRAPRPARFRARVARNGLELELRNVHRLRLQLDESPLDTTRPIPIALSFDGKRAKLRVPPAAKRSVVIVVDPDTATARFEESAPRPAFRLHTPGGPNQLYNGDPLLIVYGTAGSAPMAAAQKAAAERASRSANAGWDTTSPARTADGVPLRENLYGRLRVKPDREVTADDVARNHLVLIGTAEQNAVVERIASRLPLRLSGERIEFSDGLSVPLRGRAVRMLHYNPDAPERLVYWVASDEPGAYGESSAVVEDLALGPTGADVIVTGGAEAALVLQRSFDSRWQWVPRDSTPLLELPEQTWSAVAMLQAEALRRATGADFALVPAAATPKGTLAFSPGLTRVSDVTPYFAPLSMMQLTGRELLAAHLLLSHAGRPADEHVVGFWPRITPEHIEADRTYSVVLTPEGVYQFAHLTRSAPARVAVSDLTVAEVLDAAATARL